MDTWYHLQDKARYLSKIELFHTGTHL